MNVVAAELPPRNTAAAAARRVALWMDEAEADAFLTLLLHAPATTGVPGEVADRLLCRIADAQREFTREIPPAALAPGRSRRRPRPVASGVRRYRPRPSARP
jgi:hypothetical protein